MKKSHLRKLMEYRLKLYKARRRYIKSINDPPTVSAHQGEIAGQHFFSDVVWAGGLLDKIIQEMKTDPVLDPPPSPAPPRVDYAWDGPEGE